MKILLYVILALVLIAIALLAWFFLIYARTPGIDLPATASEKEKLDYVDDYLSKLQEEGKFNGAVLFARKQEPLLMKAYGFTDAWRKETLTTESSFRLASVSKQFTAAGILRAQELGLLDIDRHVTDYLKTFPYPTVTVRHLLNQTGGVPDNYMRLAQENVESLEGPLTIGDVVRLVSEEAETPKQEPGKVFAYSNTNYVLLAGIIEAVSQQSFETFMSKELFQPLGMKHTRVWNLLSLDETFPGKTEGFRLIGGQARALKPDFIDGVAGDGAVFSSISDFLIWDRFWSGNDLINNELLQLAFQPVNLPRQKISYYGFGWLIDKKGFHWHNGSWLGAGTYIGRNAEKETLLVLLDNSENVRMDDIAREVGKVWRGLD